MKKIDFDDLIGVLIGILTLILGFFLHLSTRWKG